MLGSLRLAALLGLGFPQVTQSQEHEPPRLVLQLTIDQLRGDLPFTIKDRWVDAGFEYLLDHGVWYANAHHPHANNETIVGHVTLATGAYPSVHGMVGNVWFDREKNRLIYNIEDEQYEPTGGVGARDLDSEVDNSQVSRTEGRSPHNILTTTLSDEISAFYGEPAKVFAVSGKDRGAISMAGHSGKAFWFSTQDGGFTSSTYFYEEFPTWVDKWNGQQQAARYAGTHWELLRDADTYRRGAYDDRPYENVQDLGFGRTFPHPFGHPQDRFYYTLLTASPVVDELTVSFAKELILREGLGADGAPDYLSLSLASTDYVGHLFGPNSLETEDNLLRLDQTLADLFGFIDQHVGLENTLIVLSADHGAPEAAQSMQQKGFPVGTLNTDQLDLSAMDSRLRETYGVGTEVIRQTFPPYVYLDSELLADRDLDKAEVSRTIAEEYTRIDGIAYAFPSSALASGELPDTPLVRKVLYNFNPKRSGDIYLVFEAHWGITFDGDVALVNHGSPWRYDSFVPVVFAGHGLERQLVYEEISTVDVAITVAKYLGIGEPSGASGRPLPEVLHNR